MLLEPLGSQARRGVDFACQSHFISAAYVNAIDRLKRFAKAPETVVLLEGEAGTGKTSLARQLHSWSSRATGPFQAVVLSTLDDGVASSELFGHVLGAFTDARHQRVGHFASAAGGTLFLDEIGKASRAVQQKLLHAIEYREIRPVGSDRSVRVDIRVVAATNVSLEVLVADHAFLPDLRARLSAFRVRIPPLRERRADIPILVEQSIARHAPACGYEELPSVDEDLLVALRRAPWPDNVRELDVTLHRILVDAQGASTLTIDHCVDDLSYLADLAPSGADNRAGAKTLSERRVDTALAQAKGSVTGAARILGVDRTTVYRFLRRIENASACEAADANAR